MKLCVPLRKSHKTSILAASLGPKSQVRFKVARKSQSIEEELMKKKAYSSKKKKFFFWRKMWLYMLKSQLLAVVFLKRSPPDEIIGSSEKET